MKELSSEEIKYWIDKANQPLEKKHTLRGGKFAKNILVVVAGIFLTTLSFVCRLMGYISAFGFPLGLWGLWQEYKFVSSGAGGVFDTTAYSLVILFIVCPIVLITLSVIFLSINAMIKPRKRDAILSDEENII